MHGVTEPGHNVSSVPHSQHQTWELLTKLLRTHEYNHSQPSWFVVWIQNLTKLHRVCWRHLVTHLQQIFHQKHRDILSTQLCFANPLPPVNILKVPKLKSLTSWQKYTDPNEHFIKSKKGSIKRLEFFCYRKVTNLDSQGIGNSTKKLNMCSIKLTSVLTNPKHVCRAIIKESGGRILTGECPLHMEAADTHVRSKTQWLTSLGCPVSVHMLPWSPRTNLHSVPIHSIWKGKNHNTWESVPTCSLNPAQSSHDVFIKYCADY